MPGNPTHEDAAPDQSEATKARALRRTRAIATAALLVCFVVFLLAKWIETRFPAMAFVAAFAEAATIGGLADWYAVTALFRRPLGLPIPHTAIIPENRTRIADNLGRFIEANFLAPEPVRKKLREVDFAALVADWLADPKRAEDLAAFLLRLLPEMLGALEKSGLRDFVSNSAAAQLRKISVAPFVADLLGAFMRENRHQQLLDAAIDMLGKLLNDETTLASLRAKIREELPSLVSFFRGDAYLLKRIVGSAGTLLEEIKADPEHPLRREFHAFILGWIADVRNSPRQARQLDRLKLELLRRPELRMLAENLWQSLRATIEKDAQTPHSAMRRSLATMLVAAGRHLAEDADIRADMNEGFVTAFSAFVESQKSGVSAFIADQVKSWDLGALVRIIEINVGRDLQYIRFNGMIVGGITGLALYALERLILPG